MRFILASSSPRRRDLLAAIGIAFDIIKPDIDETQRPDEPPLAYVQRLSQQKAAAVAAQLTPDAFPTAILAADTIVILAADPLEIQESGEILGKPAHVDEARNMLTRLRNRPHLVCTAFTLLKTGATPQQHTEVVTTKVFMRDYSDDEIEAYIATGDPFDKAGSYAIQHEAFHPVAHIEGSYNNVVGLPVDAVRIALQHMGVQS